MAAITAKAATAASIFSLLSVPGDKTLCEKPVSHPDFATTTGYNKRTINDRPYHTVSWDGQPGAETILREDGRRSGALWSEFRSWHAAHFDAGLEAHGNRVCELLQTHFGPYDHATSAALGRRRTLEERKAQLTKDLEKIYPPVLLRAAREYLGGPPTYTLAKANALSRALTLPTVYPVELLTTNEFPHIQQHEPQDISFSKSEAILRHHLAKSCESAWALPDTLEQAALSIIEKSGPFLTALNDIEFELLCLQLPPIPDEGSPADPDLIPYGRLICRHRAVIAAIPLADAGFDVELVCGTREHNGLGFPHLFVYNEQLGVLEPSSSGPVFWIKVASQSGDPKNPILSMADGSVYRFQHRTKINRPF